MTSSSIACVDLAATGSSDLTEALVEFSCVFVTGHGVPDVLRRELVEESRAFFDLPVAEKAKVRWPGDGYWRGWQPLSESKVVIDGRPPELLERFEFQMPPGAGLATSDDELWDRSGGFAFWPEYPKAFRMAWARYYAALADLSARVIKAIAETLDLPTAELADWCDNQHGNLVVNNYLPQGARPPAGQIRQKAHTDIGGLTVLWADDAPGGLEVRVPGTPGWTEVRFQAGALLVQAGDLLDRWTNHTLRANIHRVVNPLGPAADTRRTSVVYFHYPALDTVVMPAPSCVSSERPARPALDAGQHLRSAVAEPEARYRHLEDSLSSTS